MPGTSSCCWSLRPPSHLSPLLSPISSPAGTVCRKAPHLHLTGWVPVYQVGCRIPRRGTSGSSLPGGMLEPFFLCSPENHLQARQGKGALRCGAVTSCHFFFLSAFLLRQSVSALLDKFKKSDQVFDINAEVDSDAEDCAPSLPDDGFASDSCGNGVAEKIGEFTENLNYVGTIRQSKG